MKVKNTFAPLSNTQNSLCNTGITPMGQVLLTYYLIDKRKTFSPSVKTFTIQVCLMTVSFTMVRGHNKVK